MTAQNAILDTSPATETVLDIDPAHSFADFAVKHLVIATVRGRVAVKGGVIRVDERAPENASVEAELDAASVATGVEQRDQHLRSPDFLDAADHPLIRFRSTRIERTGAEAGRIHGELTMRGVTRPVVLDATFDGEALDPWGKRRAAFSAETTLDRKEWGLTWNQALEAGGWLVGDRLKVTLNVSAVKRA